MQHALKSTFTALEAAIINPSQRWFYAEHNKLELANLGWQLTGWQLLILQRSTLMIYHEGKHSNIHTLYRVNSRVLPDMMASYPSYTGSNNIGKTLMLPPFVFSTQLSSGRMNQKVAGSFLAALQWSKWNITRACQPTVSEQRTICLMSLSVSGL